MLLVELFGLRADGNLSCLGGKSDDSMPEIEPGGGIQLLGNHCSNRSYGF